MKSLDADQLDKVLTLLDERLKIINSPSVDLVVCGGSALIATKMINRTTKDVDIVARVESNGMLIDPEPLPTELVESAKVVAENFHLPMDWLNCGPSDLFRMGLPDNFSNRLQKQFVGEKLTIFFIGRLDQIFFKLYASVDRGGYHIEDLLKLVPTPEELVQAAKWSMTHDVSEGYALMLRQLLSQLGFDDAARQI